MSIYPCFLVRSCLGDSGVHSRGHAVFMHLADLAGAACSCPLPSRRLAHHTHRLGSHSPPKYDGILWSANRIDIVSTASAFTCVGQPSGRRGRRGSWTTG